MIQAWIRDRQGSCRPHRASSRTGLVGERPRSKRGVSRLSLAPGQSSKSADRINPRTRRIYRSLPWVMYPGRRQFMPTSRPQAVSSPSDGPPKIPAGRTAPQTLPKSFPGHDTLTPREREVLAQIIAGRSGKEAGRALAISQRTVEFHRANLMAKIGARKTVDLVRKVLCVSLADPSDGQQDGDATCTVSLSTSVGQP